MFEDSPAILRKVLARHLQTLRERAGRSFTQAAGELGLHHTTVRRMERAEHRLRISDLRALLSYYGADEAEVRALVALAERAALKNWWEPYSDLLDGPMTNCLTLESGAARIRAYAPWEVPALLQTAEYARAIAPRPEPDRWIELLERRQALLDSDGSPMLWAVLDESALRWEVGDCKVMTGQLAHLLTMASRPHITIQVVPFSAGPAPAARAGACCVYRLRPKELPDIVCAEQLEGLVFVDKPAAVAAYTEVLDQTAGQATPRGEPTRRLLEGIHEDWRRSA
ncbi:helix-turn-helix domain-containing protein [Streptomyces sp. NA02950]|uniref:helix-turn-helix domain-containing protein n=1 Tax=Streptomyces sp. NA02950 TaxID=2742137 RepID=UPI0015921715|nr:helix-turn-helix transcriptional regulator [Streptomyces sp. NA02950]QKV90400.1 helix-turn-helix domain-containing protein [Streptomyces sp. NA02950]QKV97267.1 helix-turn-helix domain-containing protein [Streptomyces sp. NA02950]